MDALSILRNDQVITCIATTTRHLTHITVTCVISVIVLLGQLFAGQ